MCTQTSTVMGANLVLMLEGAGDNKQRHFSRANAQGVTVGGNRVIIIHFSPVSCAVKSQAFPDSDPSKSH